jgi:hypothetical protein
MSAVSSLTEKTRRVASVGKSSGPKFHCEDCLGIVESVSSICFGQRLGNPADGHGAAGRLVNFDQGALEEDSAGGDLEFLRRVGAETLDDRLDFAA